MIFLDTNVVIDFINRRIPIVPSPAARTLRARALKSSFLAIALFEIRYGAANSDRSNASCALWTSFSTPVRPVAPFDEADAAQAGEIRAQFGQGNADRPYDIFIAAQARRRGATLVTANTREFLRVPGLLVVDWAA